MAPRPALAWTASQNSAQRVSNSSTSLMKSAFRTGRENRTSLPRTVKTEYSFPPPPVKRMALRGNSRTSEAIAFDPSFPAASRLVEANPRRTVFSLPKSLSRSAHDTDLDRTCPSAASWRLGGEEHE